MKFFGQRCYASFKPDGTPGSCPSSNSTPPQSTLLTQPTGFVLNGLPRKNPSGNAAEQLGATPGAPFADPAVDDNGNPVGTLRRYQAAAIQANVTFNKKKLGWHYPQQRMLALWKDASPTIEYTTSGGASGRSPNRSSSVEIPATSLSTGTRISFPITTTSTISRYARPRIFWASTSTS